ncbi:MAG: leucine-rich repeat protein [Oscillospiraceae bacterium]|nr:leucine-rich repeat protein [Oscillospiraceae bacterium]
MKKMISILCALSLCASFTSVFADSSGDKEYSSEGGYFITDYRGITCYYDTDGSKYDYYLHEDTNSVSLYYRSGTKRDVIVPETVNGVPVTMVSGFEGNRERPVSIIFPDTVTTIDSFDKYINLKSIKLSNSLTEIGYAVFSECTSLESIEIPSSVTKIDQAAFSKCTSLRRVTFNEGLLSIGVIAFADCPIEFVKLPSTLAKIGRSCFLRNKALKTITIPENVRHIEENVFGQSAIETVELKCKAEYIGYGAFSGENLREVAGLSKEDIIQFWTAFNNTPWQKQMVDENEPFLVDKNGRLVAYVGTQTEIELPDTVKTVGSGAFAGKPITSVVIPSSVTEIEETAFYQCEELRSITIPASVTQIGKLAFSNCYRLKNITFEYSDKMLNLGSSAFQFTLASPETVMTNNRRYSNQQTAFQNTYFDEDYVPVSNNGVYYDDEYIEPEQLFKPPTAPEATAAASPTTTEVPVPEVTETPEELTVTANSDGISVSIGNKEVDFNDAQPFVDENGRTQIPFRAVAEALGCTVDWDDETQTATLSKDNRMVIIKIGNANMQIGKNIITMDTTAQIVNERTYIPVRFVGEALGMKVNWESK